jgi:hypothetical protein
MSETMRELLAPLYELREFAAAAARVIVAGGDMDALEGECKRLGIKDGVGVRAQNTLAALLPLLEAGQAMADNYYMGTGDFPEQWEAALAEARKETTK